MLRNQKFWKPTWTFTVTGGLTIALPYVPQVSVNCVCVVIAGEAYVLEHVPFDTGTVFDGSPGEETVQLPLTSVPFTVSETVPPETTRVGFAERVQVGWWTVTGFEMKSFVPPGPVHSMP